MACPLASAVPYTVVDVDNGHSGILGFDQLTQRGEGRRRLVAMDTLRGEGPTGVRGHGDGGD